jgi:hypothetical protein
MLRTSGIGTTKGIKLVLAILLLGLTLAANPIHASQDGYRYWGEVYSGEYRPLHPYTLNWTGDVLDRGGMDLDTLTITSDGSEADFVINQYGAFGARSIVRLSGELGERTSVYQQGALPSITMTQGDIYLIALSSGGYAKIRIDQIGTDRVLFSYVLETDAPVVQEPQQPAATQPGVQPGQPQQPTVPPLSGEPSRQPATQQPPTQQPSPQQPSTQQPPTQQPQQPAAQQPAGVPMTIRLTIGESHAAVQGQKTELLAAPIIRNGTTLVPLRFIAESLGAEVEWNGADRSITLTQKDKTIVLYIDSTTAFINGRPHTLLAAPIIQNSTTLVPVRFISETFDMEVGYDAATKTVTIIGMAASGGASHPSIGSGNGSGNSSGNGSGSSSGNHAGAVSTDALYGAWQLSAYGTEAGGLAIDPDGTWVHRVMWEGELTGSWRYPEPGEYPDDPNALILRYGHEGVDWAVAVDEQGQLVMSYRYVVKEGGLFGGRELGWWKEYTGVKISDDPKDVKNIRMSTIEYDYTKFYGTWNLWTEGGAINLYDVYTGNYVTHRIHVRCGRRHHHDRIGRHVLPEHHHRQADRHVASFGL